MTAPTAGLSIYLLESRCQQPLAIFTSTACPANMVSGRILCRTGSSASSRSGSLELSTGTATGVAGSLMLLIGTGSASDIFVLGDSIG